MSKKITQQLQDRTRSSRWSRVVLTAVVLAVVVLASDIDSTTHRTIFEKNNSISDSSNHEVVATDQIRSRDNSRLVKDKGDDATTNKSRSGKWPAPTQHDAIRRRRRGIKWKRQIISTTPPLGPETNTCPELLLTPDVTADPNFEDHGGHYGATMGPGITCDPDRCRCTFYPPCLPCPLLPTTVFRMGPQPPFYPPRPDGPMPGLCPGEFLPGICPLEDYIRPECLTPVPDPWPPTIGEEDGLDQRDSNYNFTNCHIRGHLTTPRKFKFPFPVPNRVVTAVEPFPRKPHLFAPTDFPLWPPIYLPRKVNPPLPRTVCRPTVAFRGSPADDNRCSCRMTHRLAGCCERKCCGCGGRHNGCCFR